MDQSKQDRFTLEHVETWRREGGVVIEKFFTSDEVSAVAADFAAVFGRSEGGDAALNLKGDGEIGRFNPAQFSTFEAVPLKCSPALNLIGVHPALVGFAQAALGCTDVQLYQCQVWAKFTGDADYDQPFHCDYVNHTLTVPAEDDHLNSVTILCYFSDVTEGHGPAHYVRRTDSSAIAGPESTLARDPERAAELQEQLKPFGRSTAAPAGSIFPYGIDVYHRGTNMTEPLGHRYAVMACFKRAGNEGIGYYAWPFHHLKPWAKIFNHATPDQLACFGVARPGHPFWTPTTIARAQARYPEWDLTPYREAMVG